MILIRSFLSGHIRIKRTREYYDAGIGPNVPFGAIGVSPVVSQNFLTNTTVPSWMDVSATTGNRMLYNSTGKLTYAPNNLLTYSNTPSNAAWSKQTMTITTGVSDPLGGTAATTLTAGGATSFVQQVIPALANRNVVASVWLRRRTGAGLIQFRNVDNGGVTNIAVTSAWAQYSLAGTANASYGMFQLNIVTSGDEVDFYAPSLSAVTYETSPRTADQVITTSSAYYGPRFDYDPSTLAAKGLLIEESRANNHLWSQDFTNATWTKTASTVTANSVASPDGLTNGTKVLANAGNNLLNLYGSGSLTTTSGTVYTQSCYVKYGNTRWLWVRIGNPDASFVAFDLQNGVVGNKLDTASAISAFSMTSVGNGWYRIVITWTASSTAAYNMCWTLGTASTPTGATVTQAGTEFFYLFGAQYETGSFATSYIPTTTASVTRAADVIKLTGTALTAVTGAQSSIISQASTFGQSGPTPIPTMVNISDGTTANYIRVNTGTGYGGRLFVTTGAVNQVNSTTGAAPTDNQTFRIGAAVKLNDFGVSYNGGAVSTDTAGTVPTMTQAAIGNWFTSASTFLNGYVQSIALYNQRLPNATLQTKSTVGSPL